MSLQLYSLCTVYVDGALLAEEVSVSIDRESRAQEVLTVAKGFAGMSPGAAMMMITIDNAVPAAGFELNAGPAMKGLGVKELTLAMAGQTLTSKGFFVKDATSHAVNSESKLNISFVGEFADWTT
jgi:hypothetical protein